MIEDNDEVQQVNNDEEAGFEAVRNAIQRLHDQGYRDVDLKVSKDEDGNVVINVVPREQKEQEGEGAEK